MENDTKVVVKQKSRKGYIIIIILLVLIIIGLVGYICYEKGIIFNKEVKQEEKAPKKEEVIKTELSALEENTIDEKINLLTDNFSKYYPIVDITKINNRDLLIYAQKKIGFNDVITKEEIEKEITNLFGNNIKIVHENIPCPVELDSKDMYLYENGIYKPNPEHGGHGGPGHTYPKTYKISIEKEDNIIIAKYKILYSNYCSDTCITDTYYKSYTDAMNRTNAILKSTDSENPGIELTDDLYNSVKDQLPETIFTFKEDNGIYNLEKVEIEG